MLTFYGCTASFAVFCGSLSKTAGFCGIAVFCGVAKNCGFLPQFFIRRRKIAVFYRNSLIFLRIFAVFPLFTEFWRKIADFLLKNLEFCGFLRFFIAIFRLFLRFFAKFPQ